MVPIARVRASVVCVDAGRLLCVRLRDPVSQTARLFAPGGAIEAGESALRAAMRETREETGYKVVVDPKSEHIAHYPFIWAGQEIACTTHFFAARLAGLQQAPLAVDDAPYNEGVVWLPLERVDDELGFNRTIHAAMRYVLGARP